MEGVKRKRVAARSEAVASAVGRDAREHGSKRGPWFERGKKGGETPLVLGSVDTGQHPTGK